MTETRGGYESSGKRAEDLSPPPKGPAPGARRLPQPSPAGLPSDDPGRPFAELAEHGLLWLINRVVFHPRGFALALHTDGDGAVTGWSLYGDGTEPWRFAESTAAVQDERFLAVETLFASLRPRPEKADDAVDP